MTKTLLNFISELEVKPYDYDNMINGIEPSLSNFAKCFSALVKDKEQISKFYEDTGFDYAYVVNNPEESIMVLLEWFVLNYWGKDEQEHKNIWGER